VAAFAPTPIVAYAEDQKPGSSFAEGSTFDLPEQEAPKMPVLVSQPVSVLFVGGPPPSARPDSVLFGALSNPKFRLAKPIHLSVTTEEGHVILTWPDADEFACGETMGEALDEFAKSIADLYVELNEPGLNLGTELQNVRELLNQHIRPRM